MNGSLPANGTYTLSRFIWPILYRPSIVTSAELLLLAFALPFEEVDPPLPPPLPLTPEELEVFFREPVAVIEPICWF